MHGLFQHTYPTVADNDKTGASKRPLAVLFSEATVASRNRDFVLGQGGRHVKASRWSGQFRSPSPFQRLLESPKYSKYTDTSRANEQEQIGQGTEIYCPFKHQNCSDFGNKIESAFNQIYTVADPAEILSQFNSQPVINNYSQNQGLLHPSILVPFENGKAPIFQFLLNDKPLYGLADSGASSCLLTSRLYHKLWPTDPPPLIKSSAKFLDCQGKELEILGTLKKAKIEIGAFCTYHDVIVFLNDSFECLVGFDLLKWNGLSVTPCGLAKDVIPNIQQVKQLPFQTTIPLFAVNTNTIWENQQIMMKVKADLSGTGFTTAQLIQQPLCCSSESLEPHLDFSDLQIYFQYVFFNPDQTTNILFKNTTNTIVCLTANTLVGHAEPVTISPPDQVVTSPNTTFGENFSQILGLGKKDSPFIPNENDLLDAPSEPKGKPCDSFHTDNNFLQDVQHEKISGPKRKWSPTNCYQAKLGPLLNPFYDLCQMARQFDSSTEEAIADRLSKIEQSFQPVSISEADINCQSDDPAHKAFITNLVHQYKHLFSKHAWDIGKVDASEISLKVKSGIQPIADRNFPVPPRLMPAARKLVQRMVDMGVLIEGESPWNSPLIFVKKKLPEKKQNQGEVGLQAASSQGSIHEDNLRLIYDARTANKCVKNTFTAYPIPKCQDLIQYFRKNKMAAVVDVTAAFFSHVLSKETRKLFSCSFDDKKYNFCRLPMGFCGSSNIFQAHISKVLHKNGLLRYKTYPDGSQEGAAAYLDNVLIFARTEKTYKELLVKFFKAMEAANYRLKLPKCHFFLVGNFVIFGMELSLPFSTIKPEKKKVEKLMDLPIPTSKRKVRSFIGMAIYFTRICPNLQVLLGPLYELTSDSVRFSWKPKHTAAFEATKRALARFPQVYLLDPSQPLIVYTDACQRDHASFICYQKHQNSLVPVLVGSHRFTTSESHFSQFQAELFALVLFATKHYNLIYASKIYYLSDCRSIQFGIKFKEINSTLMRWWILLCSLDFKVIFTPSTDCLIMLTDLLTRRNNVIKKTNKKLTQEDVSKLKFIDFFNIPPLSLAEINQICMKFNNWVEKIQLNAKETSIKSPRAAVKAVTTCPLDFEEKINLPLPSFSARVTSNKSIEKEELKKTHLLTSAINTSLSPSSPTRVMSNKSEMEGELTKTHLLSSVVSIQLNSQSRNESQYAFTENEGLSEKSVHYISLSNLITKENNEQPAPLLEKSEIPHFTNPPATLCLAVKKRHVVPSLPNVTLILPEGKFGHIDPESLQVEITKGNSSQDVFAHIEYITHRTQLIPVLYQYLPQVTVAQLIKEQSLDKKLQALFKRLHSVQGNENFHLVDGVLCARKNIKVQSGFLPISCILCPQNLVKLLFQHNHVQGFLHLNFKKLKQHLQRAWIVPNAYQHYTEFISHCKHCLLNVKAPVKAIHPGMPIQTFAKQTIAMDICVIETRFSTNNAFMVIVDVATLWVIAVPCCKDVTAVEAAKLYFQHFYAIWGPSSFLIRDNASYFTGSDFNILLRLTGCHPVTITGYQSTANTCAEALNKYITLSLRAIHQIHPLQEGYMAFYLSIASLTWNTLPHQKTGFPPSLLMTGSSASPFKDRIQPPQNMDNLPGQNTKLLRQLLFFYELSFEVYLKTANKYFQAKNDRVAQTQFMVGDFVIVQKAPLKNKGPGAKLRPRYFSQLFRIRNLGQVSAVLVPVDERLQLHKIYKGHGLYLHQKLQKVKFSRLKKVKQPFLFLQNVQHFVKKLSHISQEVQNISTVYLGRNETKGKESIDQELLSILGRLDHFPKIGPDMETQLMCQQLIHSRDYGKIPENACFWIKQGLLLSSNRNPSYSSLSLGISQARWTQINFNNFRKNPEKFQEIAQRLWPKDCDLNQHRNSDGKKFWHKLYFWDQHSDNSSISSYQSLAVLQKQDCLPATLQAMPSPETRKCDNFDGANEDIADQQGRSDNDDNDDVNTEEEVIDTGDHDGESTQDSDDDVRNKNFDGHHGQIANQGRPGLPEGSPGRTGEEENNMDDSFSSTRSYTSPQKDTGNPDMAVKETALDRPSSPRTPKSRPRTVHLPHSPALHLDDVHENQVPKSSPTPQMSPRVEDQHQQKGSQNPKGSNEPLPIPSSRKSLVLTNISTRYNLRKNPRKSEAFFNSTKSFVDNDGDDDDSVLK